jgi:uncharacterized membrane protein YphA (DoxX/SURF4 family)
LLFNLPAYFYFVNLLNEGRGYWYAGINPYQTEIMKILINLSRFIVGVLFIFSGLIKANDPLGLSYKMQEFFDVWNIHWLNNFTLPFSVVMIVFEIIAGVAILLGWRMKLFSWLLLLLILFFTFLTGYAFLTGKVRECGCFGNCIPLTAGQSFLKDLFLLVLILYLFIYKDRIQPILPNMPSQIILILTLIFSFSLQWYVLQYLPLKDCLPYSIGTNIPEKMKSPPGAIPDSTVISLIYDNKGNLIEFTADKFPADFNDSTYKFVKRYDKLVRKGNAEPAIKDFSLITLSGNDTTQEILTKAGNKIFVFAKEFQESNPSWNKEFSIIFSLVKMKNIPVYFVTSDTEGAEDYLNKNNLSQDIPLFKCDATAIKTAARADPTLFLLRQGTIMGKWSAADFENAIKEISRLPGQ